jgi:hypothetical protein
MNSLVSIAFAAAAALAIASAAGANIVANGGFETGDFSSWGTTLGGPGTLLGVDSNFGRTGLHSVFFAATSPQDDEIFQILPTTMGLEYTIEFWVHNYGVGEDHLRLSWEGSPVLDMIPVASPRRMGPNCASAATTFPHRGGSTMSAWSKSQPRRPSERSWRSVSRRCAGADAE